MADGKMLFLFGRMLFLSPFGTDRRPSRHASRHASLAALAHPRDDSVRSANPGSFFCGGHLASGDKTPYNSGVRPGHQDIIRVS